MSQTSADNDRTQAARAEAAAWITRLHSPDRSADMEAGFKRWLAERPENAAEFEGMTEIWDLAGCDESTRGVPRLPTPSWRRDAPLDPTMTMRRPRSSSGRWWAVAAIAVVVCGSSFIGARIALAPPTFTTDIGEQRVLQLEDGSRASLNSQTRLVVKFSAGRRVVQLQRGEALFDVAKEQTRPFVVIAGDHQVTAVGTSFLVRHEPARTQVTLIEGKVRVTRLEAAESGAPGSSNSLRRQSAAARNTAAVAAGDIVLTAGQRLQLAGTNAPTLDAPPIEAVTAWRRGEVMLHDTPLAEAVAEMNRYDRTAIVLDDARTGEHLVSGLYHAGDSEGFARSVAHMYQLRVVIIDGRIHLKE